MAECHECHHCCACVKELCERLEELETKINALLTGCDSCHRQGKICQCVKCPKCRGEEFEVVKLSGFLPADCECVCGRCSDDKTTIEHYSDCYVCALCGERFHRNRMRE